VPRGVFSPVYIDNLVDGVTRAAAAPAGHVFTLTDGRGVPNEQFFGNYFRMLGKSPPRTLPAAPLKAFAWGYDRAARLRGKGNELNPGAIAYLSRTGTYSIEKARRELGYEPQVDLAEGMARTERWLRDEGMLAR